jgi:transposase
LLWANHRQHRALNCRPVDRVDADRAAMVALPPVPPVVGWRLATRLPRDHYVRLDANDYSVHPSVVGRRVEVHADLDQVSVSCDGRPVAAHQRCWAAHQTITDPAHRQAAAALRARARQAPVPKLATNVEHHRLADYDRAFGIDDAQAVA